MLKGRKCLRMDRADGEHKGLRKGDYKQGNHIRIKSHNQRVGTKSLILLFLVFSNCESIDNTNGTVFFVFRMYDGFFFCRRAAD